MCPPRPQSRMVRNYPVPLLHALYPGTDRQHLKAGFISRDRSRFRRAERIRKERKVRIVHIYLIDIGRIEGGREGS